MEIADRRWGCHQIPERSFFLKGYQFPICARCTGVLIGYILSIFLFSYISFPMCIGLAIIMLLDWVIQYLNIAQSTNIRRLITGSCGGLGCMCFVLKIIILAINFFISII
ncbi:DUF2085 domain-containing protein [Clostridium sp. 19966]|nr:DUF2085 domain-containing protein [Clostridium sp. 19966]